MYACGLTVYSRGHIGNFRTFVAIDVLRRTLRHLEHYKVRHVVNFTDVDDRTIAGSQKAGMPLREYTNQWIDAFLEDSRALGLEDVEERPRATDEENLDSMAQLVRALEKNGHTYESDGSVYFKISTLPQYGRLARLDHDGLKAGARVDSDNYDKDNARDFVLWKATKPSGEGPADKLTSRAGTLDSAAAARVASRVLGDGAAPAGRAAHRHPLRRRRSHFSASRKRDRPERRARPTNQFSRFWVHVEHLLIDEEKMSKSLGNVFNLPDIVAKGYRPSTLRYLLLATHYRKQVKFSWDAMSQAEESLRRLADFVERLDRVTAAGAHPDIAAKVSAAEAQFKEAMEQDLNTAGALGAIFELVRMLNAAIDNNELGTGDVPVVKAAFDRIRSGARRARAAARGRSTDRAAGRRDRSPRRGAPGRAQAPRLRGGRSHPPTAARRGDRAGRFAGGHAVETEITCSGIRSGLGIRD